MESTVSIRPRRARGAVLLGTALLLAACGDRGAAGRSTDTIPAVTRTSLPTLHQETRQGLGSVLLTSDSSVLAMDSRGAMAMLSGSGHLRDLNVVDADGMLHTSILRLATIGAEVGPLSMVMVGDDVHILRARTGEIQRFAFSGEEAGRAITVPGAVRLIGSRGDSLLVVVRGSAPDAADSLMVVPTGRGARRFIAALTPGDSTAAPPPATSISTAMVAVAGNRIVVMDAGTGAMREMSYDGEPALTAGDLSRAANDGLLLGVFVDDSGRIWRLAALQDKVRAEIFSDGGLVGALDAQCHMAQRAALHGNYLGILCSLPGSVDARPLQPVLFRIAG